MSYKKEDLDDTSMESYWPSARAAPAPNYFGKLPPPQRGGEEEDEKATLRQGSFLEDKSTIGSGHKEPRAKGDREDCNENAKYGAHIVAPFRDPLSLVIVLLCVLLCGL